MSFVIRSYRFTSAVQFQYDSERRKQLKLVNLLAKELKETDAESVVSANLECIRDPARKSARQLKGLLPQF